MNKGQKLGKRDGETLVENKAGKGVIHILKHVFNCVLLKKCFKISTTPFPALFSTSVSPSLFPSF